MHSDKKISEMMINVGGDLLQGVNSHHEMQVHLDLVKVAWNIATKPPLRRKTEIKRFIKKQKEYAPNIEALKELEWEIIKIMKQKDSLYPEINNKVVLAEAIDNGGDNYTIRAYFKVNVNS